MATKKTKQRQALKIKWNPFFDTKGVILAKKGRDTLVEFR